MCGGFANPCLASDLQFICEREYEPKQREHKCGDETSIYGAFTCYDYI